MVRRLFFDRASARALVFITLPAALIAIGLLLTPGRLYSAKMTWDMFFNLDGAWRVYNGQVPHVDFHTELGSLPFILTALGFEIAGPNVLGLPIGECLFALFVLVLCIFAVADRLPLVPAAIFTVLSIYIVLVPSNYGDTLRAFSFAMAYNRFAWAISGILFVLVFVEPLGQRQSTAKDCALGLVMLLLLYYTKITYFCVGMAAVAAAFFIPGHVHANRRSWVTVFAIVAANSVAPYNFDYIRDILSEFLVGGARTNPLDFLVKFIADPAEYAVALAGCILLIAAPSVGPSRNQRLFAAWFLLVAGPALLSQNAQNHGIPIYVIICLLVYGAAHELIIRQPTLLNNRRKSCFLVVPLIFPLLLSGGSSFTLLCYFLLQVEKGDKQFVVPVGNLQALAVPIDEFTTCRTVARQGLWDGQADHPPEITQRCELSQFEFMQNIMDLASLWDDSSATKLPRHVQVMDVVNPLPFALGWPSPRGIDLWWGDSWGNGLVERSGDEVFADTDFVAIPRHPAGHATGALMDYYGHYLTDHFVPWRDTSDWIVLRREAGPTAN
jgi:hypothetical protein